MQNAKLPSRARSCSAGQFNPPAGGQNLKKIIILWKTLHFELCTLNYQRGQALLIVVLVMVISLTVGLSVASRSITNLRTSNDEANSQKAFSAAEAGIERALKTNTPVPNFSIGDVSVKDIIIEDLSSRAGDKLSLNGGNPINQDDGIDVWLVGHDGNDNIDYVSDRWATSHDITFYWGPSSDGCVTDPNKMPAIELIVITKGTSVQSTRYAFDPCSARAGTNFFAAANIVSGHDFAYNATITIPKEGILVRVIPIYASTIMNVSGDIALPSQGKIIRSTGESGGSQRKIVYYKGYKKLPSEFFQYALFSH